MRDKWKATVSAVNSPRSEHRLSESELKQKILNHGQGELKNSRVSQPSLLSLLVSGLSGLDAEIRAYCRREQVALAYQEY